MPTATEENIQQASQPVSGDGLNIDVRKEFQVAGQPRVIYDVNVDDRGFFTSGWKISDGSKIAVSGSGLDFFRQVGFVSEAGLYYPATGLQNSGGRLVTFTVPEGLANRVADGAVLHLVFHDPQDSSRNRHLKQIFRYRAKSEEAKEAGKRPGGKAGPENGLSEEDKRSQSVRSDSIRVFLDAAAAPAQAFAQGYQGTYFQQGKKTPAVTGKLKSEGRLASSVLGGKRNTVTGAIADKAVESGAEISQSEAVNYSEKSAGKTQLTFRQAAEIVGEYLDKNPELVVDATVRSRIISDLSVASPQEMSAGSMAVLRQIAAAPEVAGNESLAGAFQALGAELPAETINSSGATAENQTSSDRGRVGETVVRQAAAPGPAVAGRREEELVGEFLYTSPSAVPDYGVRARLVEALHSGAIEPLVQDPGSQLALQDLAQGRVKAPPEVSQAAGLLLKSLGESGARPSIARSQGDGSRPGRPIPAAGNPQGADLVRRLKRNDISDKFSGPRLARPIPESLAGTQAAPITAASPKAEDSGAAQPLFSASEAAGRTAGPSEAVENSDIAPLSTERQVQPSQNNTEMPGYPGDADTSSLAEPDQAGQPAMPSGDGSDQEAREPGEPEDEDEQEELASPPLPSADFTPSVPAGKKTGAAAEAAIGPLLQELNLSMNAYLLELALMGWAAILSTLGLMLLPVTIIADLIWLLKKPLVKKALSVLPASVKKPLAENLITEDELAGRIRFSMAVKMNIIAYNLVSGLVVLLAALLLLLIGCNYPFSGPGSTFSLLGYGDLCKSANMVQESSGSRSQ